MRKSFLLSSTFLLLIFLFASCNFNSSEQEIQENTIVEPILSIPGNILLPETDDFSEFIEQDHDAVLLYCWLPMGQYPESTNDLQFLSTIQEWNVVAMPIQFSTIVRNASQTQLNDLGITLSVGLGDDSVKNFMDLEILPTAVLIRKDGSIERANGFGCAERALRANQ